MWVCFPPSAPAVFKGHLPHGGGGDKGEGGNGSDGNRAPSDPSANGGARDAERPATAPRGATSAREGIDLMETMENLATTSPPLPLP